MSHGSDCCGTAGVLDQIRSLYTELAKRPDKDFGWGSGKQNARRLGYDPAWLDCLPDAVWESAAAVGNPFSLGPIHPGETVIDLGCGAGADACIAALLVGATGRVIGFDVTRAMVEKATANAHLAGLSNVEVHEADMMSIPLPRGIADVVISNGAINLAPDKAAVFSEAERILRPGGRFQFADIVHEGKQRCGGPADDGDWAGCVSGALPAGQVVSMLRETGFVAGELVSVTDYRTSPNTIGAVFRALKVHDAHQGGAVDDSRPT
jgi:SAM-dependent methyltransferase